MIDEKLAMLRTRRNNIRRYDRLLKTNLTDFERQFIERRRSEERSAMENLAASTFPVAFSARGTGIPSGADAGPPGAGVTGRACLTVQGSLNA